MKHQNLLWFGAGAATSAAVSISASLIFARPPAKVPFLQLEEPLLLQANGQIDEASTFPNQTGEILRNCGAKRFEMETAVTDAATYAALPLTEENAASFHCVLEKSAADRIRLDIKLHTDRNAQTH